MADLEYAAQVFAHMSDHQGQIALVLKQSGMRLPAAVAIRASWQDWYWGET